MNGLRSTIGINGFHKLKLWRSLNMLIRAGIISSGPKLKETQLLWEVRSESSLKELIHVSIQDPVITIKLTTLFTFFIDNNYL